MWICNVCHEKNESEHNFCQICGTARSVSEAADNGEKKIGYDSGADSYDETGHVTVHTDIKKDQISFGMWKCKCGQMNQNDYRYCINCRLERPTKTVEPSEGGGGGKNVTIVEKEPPTKTLIICITAVIIALILLAAVAISSKSNNMSYSTPRPSNVQSTVTATPTTTPTQSTNPPKDEQWGEWSEWSTTPRTASSTVQVEQRQNTRVLGYYMVHYGTQEAKSPHNRMFRNYSIKDDLDRYGARTSYGEKHLTKYITINDVSKAVAYPANGDMVEISYGGEIYRGYQMGTDTAYNFGDDKYVWFIESEDAEIITEYRYRERK